MSTSTNTTTGESGAIVFDYEQVSRMAGADVRFARELVNLFLARLPSRLARLSAALDGNDLAGITRAAHSIKGASNVLGAVQLGVIAAVIEDAAWAQDLEETRRPVPTLLRAIDAFRDTVAGFQWPEPQE